ncbi:MAG: ABC transporter substrate-binding protein [Anaerolineae bacterium]
MSHLRHVLPMLTILAVLLSACQGLASTDEAPLVPVSLPMGYVASVQFSPFYVAKERGYFDDAGFEVRFDYRWETDGIQLVAAGELPFTVASGDQVIQARSQGLPVVAVASWYQRFPVGVIALENVPLNSPGDLRGLSVGIPETFGASYIGLRALLSAGGLTEDDIDLRAIGYTQLAALTTGQVDAVVVYANNEPVVLAEEGTPFNAIYVADYADMVSAVIASSDSYTEQHPQAVRRFVAAFLMGLEDVIEGPEEAFEISETYIEGLDDNSEEQWAVLLASIDLWETPQLGRFEAEAWSEAQDVMFNAGLIEERVPVEDLYTNEFIQDGP